jgi:transposase InsO family protein
MTVFIDDLLIYSENELDHQNHVRLVLERLRKAGLQASIQKCEFHVTRTKYLGFIVSTQGIETDPEKIMVIQQWKKPSTVRGVQSFLGFCNFYRRFIKNYSRIARPLNRLTKQDTPFLWDASCREAFEKLKGALTSSPVLTHYDQWRPTRLETDASDGAIAAVLSQHHGGHWHPVAFYSRTMVPAEQNYDIHDKEMLAIIQAFKEWRAELSGLKERFDVYTDHHALEYFMTTKKLNARQARWAEFLPQFHFLIRYRPGKENTLADALTRKDEPTMKTHRTIQLLRPEWLEEGVQSQTGAIISALEPAMDLMDRVLQANRQAATQEPHASYIQKEGWEIDDQGRLTYHGKLYVPDNEDLRACLLDEVHQQPSIAHPGRAKTKKLLHQRYYWETWNHDVDRYTDNCLVCKRTKTRRDLPPGLLQPLPIPDRPWQHITMDFRSFPKSQNGYDAALVIVDRLGKRGFAIPCHKTATSKDMARLFLTYIYPWVGLPDTIVSDRGGQFISDFWDELCKILKIKIKLSSGQHPQTNGQSEVMNQYIAQRLRPYVDYYQQDWDEWLPMLNFAAAALPHDSTGVSPFLMERGFEPRTSFDWKDASPPVNLKIDRQAAQALAHRMEEIWKHAKANMEHAQQQQKSQADKHRQEVDFKIGERVMVITKDWNLGRPSPKLGDQLAGPYPIIAKEGASYRLQLPDSIKVHPVFAPEKLRKAATREPLPGQVPDPQPPIEVDNQEEWEVQEILAVRLHYHKLQYRVRWIGHDDDPTWYPAQNFKNAASKIQTFHEKFPTLPGPPKRLQEWLRAAEEDDFLMDHPDDDSPLNHD